jgi:hypothetical protein
MDKSFFDGRAVNFLDAPALEKNILYLCFPVNANPTRLRHGFRLNLVYIFLLIAGQGSRPLLPIGWEKLKIPRRFFYN